MGWSVILVIPLLAVARAEEPSAPVRTATAPQQAIPVLPVIGQFGGRTARLAVESDTAAVAVGPRLVVIDLGQPDAPAKIAESRVVSTTLQAVARRGSTAVVGGLGGGLWVFDLSDRHNATLNGHLATADTITDLAFLDGGAEHVAAVDLSGRLSVLDISDPSRIAEVGTLELPAPSGGVVVAGEHLLATYCADGGESGGLAVLRASPPTQPQLVGRIDLPECVFDVARQNTHAYVAAGDRVIIFDVSDPSQPRVVGELTDQDLPDHFSPPHTAIAALGDRLYVATGGTIDARIDDVPRPNGMLVVDVEDPTRPQVIGHWSTGSLSGLHMTSGLVDLALAGDRVVATEDGGHVHVLELSAAGVPSSAARLDFGLRGNGLAASEGSLYQIDGWGVQSMPLDGPSSPPPGLFFDGFAGTPSRIAVEGERLLVSTHGTFANMLLSLDARTLRPLGSVAETEVHDMVVRDGLAYIAGRKATWVSDPGTAILRVLDVAEPGDPMSWGELELGSGWPDSLSLTGICLADNLALVSGQQDSLIVADVSDPARPSVVGRLRPSEPGPESASAVGVFGHHALLLEAERLHVVELSDPRSPRWVTAHDLDARMHRMVVDGAVAYLVGGRRLVVLDLSDPLAPRAIGALDASPVARFFGVTLWGEYAYVGADAMGVLVIPRVRTGPDGTPSPRPTHTATIATPSATITPDGTLTTTPRPSATVPSSVTPVVALSLPLTLNGARPAP